MPRTLSSIAAAAITGAECDEVFVHLLEISHASFTTVRLCNDNVDIVHGGNTYTAFPFVIGLLNESEGEIPRPTVIFDNIDRTLTQILEQVNTPATVVHKVVLASQPNTLEVPAVTYKLREIVYDVFQIQAVLSLALLARDAFPFHTITPATAPGAFGALNP